jgi:hypothetical protein
MIGTGQSDDPPIQRVGVVIFSTDQNGEMRSHASGPPGQAELDLPEYW